LISRHKNEAAQLPSCAASLHALKEKPLLIRDNPIVTKPSDNPAMMPLK